MRADWCAIKPANIDHAFCNSEFYVNLFKSSNLDKKKKRNDIAYGKKKISL